MIAPYSGGSFLQSAVGRSAQAAAQPMQPGQSGGLINVGPTPTIPGAVNPSAGHQFINVGQTPQIPQRPSPYPQPFATNYSSYVMPGQAPMQPKVAEKSNLMQYVQAARAEMARRRAAGKV